MIASYFRRARFRQAGSVIVATILAALTFSIIVAPSAQAATNPYTPEQVCGSGYQRVSPNATLTLKNGSQVWGYTYLLYSSATRKNCVVTIKAFEIGVETYTLAGIQIRGQNVTDDHGYYAYYAGPKYVSAPGECVRIRGVMWEDDMQRYAQADGPYGWCD